MMISRREDLVRRRSEVLKDIAAAASVEDTTTLLNHADRLRSIDDLLGSYSKLDSQAEALLTPAGPGEEPSFRRALPTPVRWRVPGRGHGKKVRAAFLDSAQSAGLDLVPLRGAIFTAPDGTRVGVAVATERQPDRWFLGLAEDGFDAAVLLCQEDLSDRTLDICLPSSFVAQHASYLSRSGGQVKFNVVRRGGRVALTIPTIGTVDVQQYLGAISGLL
jgi:hypothetical protein